MFALFEITLKLTLNKLTSCLAAFLLMLNPEFATRSVDCLKESALISVRSLGQLSAAMAIE